MWSTRSLATKVALIVLLVLELGCCSVFSKPLHVALKMRKDMASRLLPDEWFCSCRRTQQNAYGYSIGNGITVLPALNNLECKVDELPPCEPAAKAKPGIEACHLGPKLTIVKPSVPLDAPRGPEFSAVTHDLLAPVVEQYRNHTCSYKKTNCDKDNFQPLKGTVLDHGGDPSGIQLKMMGEAFEGPVVGYNIHDGLGLTTYMKESGRFAFVFGNVHGCLPFADASFDYVISINLLEHANPVQRYLTESYRVLKPGGLFYARWYPIWWGAEGHHVQEGMVKAWLKDFQEEDCIPNRNEIKFKEILPLWSHLLFSRAEMEHHLYTTQLMHCPKTRKQIVDFVYNEDETFSLNKASVSEIVGILEALGMQRVYSDFVPITNGMDYQIANRVAKKYGHADILLAGGEVAYAKPHGTDSLRFKKHRFRKHH